MKSDELFIEVAESRQCGTGYLLETLNPFPKHPHTPTDT